MDREIDEVIETVVRQQFADVKIDSVIVDEGTDFEGDPVLRVTVIVDNSNKPLDSGKTSRIVGFVRDRLSEKNEFRFPIFTFMSRSDARRFKTAAA